MGSQPFKRIGQPGEAARRKHQLFMGQVRAFRAAYKAKLDASIERALVAREKNQSNSR